LSDANFLKAHGTIIPRLESRAAKRAYAKPCLQAAGCFSLIKDGTLKITKLGSRTLIPRKSLEDLVSA